MIKKIILTFLIVFASRFIALAFPESQYWAGYSVGVAVTLVWFKVEIFGQGRKQDATKN